MKIAWVQDLSPLTTSGGAQLTDRTHIFEGFKRGHAIQLVVPNQNLEDINDSYDLAIISNSMTFHYDEYPKLLKRGVPYVIFAHDMGPWVCRWRLLYSMEERCKALCYLRERWSDALQKASMCVWLSPLHMDAWLFAYPWLGTKPYSIVPSPVDATRFFDMKKPRKGVVAVNESTDYKGALNLIKWATEHPATQITLLGGNPEGKEYPENVEVKDYVPYLSMNEAYNQYEFFIHLPANVMPCERTTIEAYLAGCKIIGNKNIGCLSFPWFTSREVVAEHCRKASEEFWGAIEKEARG